MTMTAEKSWKDNVKLVLEEVRPALMADGGDVQFVSADDDGTVKLALQGHCRGCPYSAMTVKNYIEQTLKERIPQVKQVVNV